jgi:hypothetical protein
VTAWPPGHQKLQHGQVGTLDVGDGPDDHLLGVDRGVVVGQQPGSQGTAKRPHLVFPGGLPGGVQGDSGQQLRALRRIDPLFHLVNRNPGADSPEEHVGLALPCAF